MDIFQNLESKTRDVLQDTGQRTVQYALCSRSGFTDNMLELAEGRMDIQLFSWENLI